MTVQNNGDEEFRRLAQLGARARLSEIEQERERLLAMFPELARKPRGPIAKAAEPAILFDAGDADRKHRKRGPREPVPGYTQHGTERKREYRPRRAWTEEQKAALVKRLKDGEYLIDVARKGDVNASQLQRWAADAKVKIVPMPPEERAKRNQRNKAGRVVVHDPALRARAVKLALATGKVNASARELGVNPSTVRGWIAAAKKEG